MSSGKGLGFGIDEMCIRDRISPVSDSWTVRHSRRGLRAASASTAMTAAGRTAPAAARISSQVSIPVRPSTSVHRAESSPIPRNGSCPVSYTHLDVYKRQVYEIVDNAIDEALAGYCTDITVTINEGNTITVTDNGRGIPVDIQKQTGRPALEVVYTVLHAGGKFGGGGYKVSGGLHGVGASVVNALSEWLEVEVHKGGKIYQMKFSRGAITQEMTVIGDTDHTGTTVRFKPDGEMFDTLEYDYETLHTRMREQAFLNAGLRISIADRRPGQEQEDTMCYEGGIREFVTWINRNKTPLHEEVIYMAGAKGD